MGKCFGFFGVGLEFVFKENNSKSKIVNIFEKLDYLYFRDDYFYEMVLK